MKVETFVNKLLAVRKLKTGYAFGTFGWNGTKEYKERMLKNSDNQKYKKEINNSDSDTWFFDCICFIKAILWGWTGNKNKNYGGAVYKSNGVPDINADQMMTTEHINGLSKDFNSLEYGHFVGMKGHIGVYIGGGKVIECTPAKIGDGSYGVLISNLSDRLWVNHGKCKYIDYAKDEKPMKKTNGEIANEVIAGKWGNNPKRKTDLEKAGYDYKVIQRIVNNKLKEGSTVVPKLNQYGQPYFVGSEITYVKIYTQANGGIGKYPYYPTASIKKIWDNVSHPYEVVMNGKTIGFVAPKDVKK